MDWLGTIHHATDQTSSELYFYSAVSQHLLFGSPACEDLPELGGNLVSYDLHRQPLCVCDISHSRCVIATCLSTCSLAVG